MLIWILATTVFAGGSIALLELFRDQPIGEVLDAREGGGFDGPPSTWQKMTDIDLDDLINEFSGSDADGVNDSSPVAPIATL